MLDLRRNAEIQVESVFKTNIEMGYMLRSRARDAQTDA